MPAAHGHEKPTGLTEVGTALRGVSTLLGIESATAMRMVSRPLSDAEFLASARTGQESEPNPIDLGTAPAPGGGTGHDEPHLLLRKMNLTSFLDL
jgi:hypothetical protein